MANLTTGLVRLCKTPKGWKRYPPARDEDGTIKPAVVLVHGRERTYPVGRYQVRWYEGRKTRYEDVGDDLRQAEAALSRKSELLQSRTAAQDSELCNGNERGVYGWRRIKSLDRRNVGEKDHSIVQRYLILQFVKNRSEWSIEAYPALTVAFSSARSHTTDLAILRSGTIFHGVLDQPPLIAIEIVSSKDGFSEMLELIANYIHLGVKHIWIVDPQNRKAYLGQKTGLNLADGGELTVPGTPIRLELSEVFADLET